MLAGIPNTVNDDDLENTVTSLLSDIDANLEPYNIEVEYFKKDYYSIS